MADRPPGDFGRSLREARERRGVSLRQIANATKIGMSALEALERNDISRLPGGIFSRAFVRSYAIEVGLDPEATIQEFIAQFPHDSVTAGHPTSTAVRRSSGDRQRSPGGDDLRAADCLEHSDRRRDALFRDGRASRGAGGAGKPAGRDVDSPRRGARRSGRDRLRRRLKRPPVAVVSPSAATFPSDRLTVALSAIGECWVSATVDGEKRIERLLQPGEQLAMEVRRELVLTAGDASALAITLNGAEAKPLGKPGEVVTARLNLTNFKDYVANR